MRRLADTGEIASVWRGSHRVFPVASTKAYALSHKPKRASDEDVDALAFGMMREGRSHEAIVRALEIPLARVLELHAHREGAPLAKTRPRPDDDDDDRASERTLDARAGRELRERLEVERAARRRRLSG
jgi:hypothetical protein